MMYSFEVYKLDARTKTGKRLVNKFDSDLFTTIEKAQQYVAEEFKDPRIEVLIRETMVEKTNLLSGQPYMERYDTPHYCSPSSETYWSM